VTASGCGTADSGLKSAEQTSSNSTLPVERPPPNAPWKGEEYGGSGPYTSFRVVTPREAEPPVVPAAPRNSRALPFRHFAIVAAACLSACGIGSGLKRHGGTVGMVFGMVKSPIGLRAAPLDPPLSCRDRLGLDLVDDELRLLPTSSSWTNVAGAMDAAWSRRQADEFAGCGQNSPPTPQTGDPERDLTRELDPFRSPPEEHLDTFEDLSGDASRPLLLVAISGGGARAARLGAHALALLEQRYEALRLRQPEPDAFAPLARLVTAYSTVSGGSLYAATLARYYPAERLRAAYEGLAHAPSGAKNFESQLMLEHSRFQLLAREPGFANIGPTAALNYLGYYLLPFLASVFSEHNFVDTLAAAVSAEQGRPIFPFPFDFVFAVETTPLRWLDRGPIRFAQDMLRMGDIADSPRFYFNATSLETGAPFVLTQRLTHLPSMAGSRQTVRLDVSARPGSDDAPAECRDASKPIRHATTLEEINASSARFPVAYAAMASAAFPVGIEPIALQKYAYARSMGEVFRTEHALHLSDGGVYDNSGLATIADLVSYLACHKIIPKGKRVMVLSINAEVDEYDGSYASTIARSGWDFPLTWQRPLQGLSLASIDLIHYTNKRRSEEIALAHLLQLAAQFDLRLSYFPVSLAQLSASDLVRIPGGESVLRLVQEMGTDFAITESDDRLLAEAAAMIMSADQRVGSSLGDDVGWRVEPPPPPVYRLDDAFAIALLRSQAPVRVRELPKRSDPPLDTSNWPRGPVESEPAAVPPPGS
jgi:hypothetical protein